MPGPIPATEFLADPRDDDPFASLASEYLPRQHADNPEASRLPAALSWAELSKPVSYENNLLGDRFLERGQGLILFGPAGCGKSVAALQAEVFWSCGLPGLHIKPVRALRIVVFQTEDSIDDVRETLAGILAAPEITPLERALIERNMVILPAVSGGSPVDLASHLREAIQIHRPDLVSVNPMLAFCPGDPTRELGGLLYQAIDPVIKAGRVGFIGVHHTTKTNNRDTSGYGTHDHQYLAAGDARVANWPRAMLQIEEARGGIYRFRLVKRAHRAGWPGDVLHFARGTNRIYWSDASEDEVETASAEREDYLPITNILPSPVAPGISRDRFHLDAKAKLGIGKGKADQWLKLATEDGLVERIETEESPNGKKRFVARFRQAPKAPETTP